MMKITRVSKVRSQINAAIDEVAAKLNCPPSVVQQMKANVRRAEERLRKTRPRKR